MRPHRILFFSEAFDCPITKQDRQSLTLIVYRVVIIRNQGSTSSTCPRYCLVKLSKFHWTEQSMECTSKLCLQTLLCECRCKITKKIWIFNGLWASWSEKTWNLRFIRNMEWRIIVYYSWSRLLTEVGEIVCHRTWIRLHPW